MNDLTGRTLTHKGESMGGLRVLARPKILTGDMHKSKGVENIVKHSLAFAKQP